MLLADPGSYHTIKWAKALAEKGIEIFIFGLSAYDPEAYKNSDINIYTEELDNSIFQKKDGAISKSIYLKTLRNLKNHIKIIDPDIIHAHYATSYGLLGSLTRFHPFILSVWGSDVYDFPKRSILHKMILQYNLNNADVVMSTTNIMAVEIGKYTTREIKVIPFGVDVEIFRSEKVNSPFKADDIVIGTVKPLEKQYGIDLLLKAFQELKSELKEYSLKLLIIGKGTEESRLKEITRELNIDKDTCFTGYIPNADVPVYLNMMTIVVFPSIKESFGVSAVEANSCAKCVIASDAPGFTEIIKDGINGLITKRGDTNSLVSALKTVIQNNELRIKLGEEGRKIAMKNYHLKDNVNSMLKIYNNMLLGKE